MARLLRAALLLPTLVLAHQLVFLARYGSIYGEALAHAGHGQAWNDAVATVLAGSAVLSMAAGVGLVRLARLLRRRSGDAWPSAPVRSRDAASAIVRRWLRTAAWLTALALVALTAQENVEHAVAGLGVPGVGILLGADYPFAIEVVASVALAVSLVATLLGWRREVLSARLAALAAAPGVPRSAGSLPRPITNTDRPAAGRRARQLGLRAPPALLPA